MSRLYDEVLMDHIREARNFRDMPQADRRGEAVSPVCGDSFRVFVRLDGDMLADVSFQCECCGISMASASIMTEWVRGRPIADALAVKDTVLDAIARHAESLGADAHPDHAAILRVVRATSNREGCASLAWQALNDAIGVGPEKVSDA